MKLKEKIYEILLSERYKASIKDVAKNYFNLKQEFWFRNLLLEQLNEDFERNGNVNFRALAEHPRIEGRRVDLSIVNSENLDSLYLVEFKFQYSGDLRKHKRTGELIEKDFELRGSDMFVLIILDFDRSGRIELDNMWGIKNGVSKYIAKTKEWRGNLNKSVAEYRKSKEVLEINHRVSIDKMVYDYKIITISK